MAAELEDYKMTQSHYESFEAEAEFMRSVISKMR